MAKATANGLQIEYDTFGDSSGSPLLLISGIGLQLIHWSEEFCQKLADFGLYVIRFDNRDAGLSTKCEEGGIPNLMEALTAILHGQKINSAYTYDDMADDAVGLLDSIGIDKAHICGMSMGGAIAQTVAIRHPLRMLSLISIYGPIGKRDLPQPKPEALSLLLTPPPQEREAFIEYILKITEVFTGSKYKIDDDLIRSVAGSAYDRSFYPQGVARQFVAGLAHGDRSKKLAGLTIPTLLIHGDEDPIVPVENSRELAKIIPGAKLMIIEGMGHDFPYKGAWPIIAQAIGEFTSKISA